MGELPVKTGLQILRLPFSLGRVIITSFWLSRNHWLIVACPRSVTQPRPSITVQGGRLGALDKFSFWKHTAKCWIPFCNRQKLLISLMQKPTSWATPGVTPLSTKTLLDIPLFSSTVRCCCLNTSYRTRKSYVHIRPSCDC